MVAIELGDACFFFSCNHFNGDCLHEGGGMGILDLRCGERAEGCLCLLLHADRAVSQQHFGPSNENERADSRRHPIGIV